MKVFRIAGWLLIGYLVLNLYCEPMKCASAAVNDDLKLQMKQIAIGTGRP